MPRNTKKSDRKNAAPCPNCELYRQRLDKVLSMVDRHWCLDDDVRQEILREAARTGCPPQALASQIVRKGLQERVEALRQAQHVGTEKPAGDVPSAGGRPAPLRRTGRNRGG